MQAMTFMLPPQTRQISMSMLNTRFKRCAQLIAAWLAIGVSLTVAVNRGGVLLSLIILPLYIPVLIFGANAVGTAADGLPVIGQLYLLGALLVLSLTLAPLAIGAALRISLS